MGTCDAGGSEEPAEVLARACRSAGLDPSGATLIRHRNNAVYLLRSAPVVVRLRRQSRTVADRTVRVARWLASQHAPVIRLLADLDQPVVAGRYVVTFWQAAGGRTARWQGADLALPLREIHRLEPLPDLPRWNPFPAIRSRIARLGDLDRPDREWLVDELARLERAYGELLSGLPQGVIHGDAHLGNLLRDRNGRIVLGDLDNVAHGPLLQDLVPTAVNAVRFRRMVRHRTLAYAYGRDVTREPAWPVLRRIRELSTTTAGLGRARDRPEVATEARLRLRTLRTGRGSARWAGFPTS